MQRNKTSIRILIFYIFSKRLTILSVYSSVLTSLTFPQRKTKTENFLVDISFSSAECDEQINLYRQTMDVHLSLFNCLTPARTRRESNLASNFRMCFLCSSTMVNIFFNKWLLYSFAHEQFPFVPSPLLSVSVVRVHGDLPSLASASQCSIWIVLIMNHSLSPI